ncbi:MAG: hypothetical protein J0I09_12700 [Sphingobacteriia bacterium]|nr:hypothetical protein [Sphingobacteriia bacterium]
MKKVPLFGNNAIANLQNLISPVEAFSNKIKTTQNDISVLICNATFFGKY